MYSVRIISRCAVPDGQNFWSNLDKQKLFDPKTSVFFLDLSVDTKLIPTNIAVNLAPQNVPARMQEPLCSGFFCFVGKSTRAKYNGCCALPLR